MKDIWLAEQHRLCPSYFQSTIAMLNCSSSLANVFHWNTFASLFWSKLTFCQPKLHKLHASFELKFWIAWHNFSLWNVGVNGLKHNDSHSVLSILILDQLSCEKWFPVFLYLSAEDGKILISFWHLIGYNVFCLTLVLRLYLNIFGSFKIRFNTLK